MELLRQKFEGFNLLTLNLGSKYHLRKTLEKLSFILINRFKVTY